MNKQTQISEEQYEQGKSFAIILIGFLSLVACASIALSRFPHAVH